MINKEEYENIDYAPDSGPQISLPWVGAIVLCAAGLGALSHTLLNSYSNTKAVDACSPEETLNDSSSLALSVGATETLTDSVPLGKIDCPYFSNVAEGSQLTLNASTPLELLSPDGEVIATVQGDFQTVLEAKGKYFLRINGEKEEKAYEITAALAEPGSAESSTGTDLPATANSGQASAGQVDAAGNQVTAAQRVAPLVTYSSVQTPTLTFDQTLSEVVNGAASVASTKGLPADRLSIKLIDLNRQSFGSYQEDVPFFPASIVKMFWMVALYEHYAAGETFGDTISEKEVKDMMQSLLKDRHR